MKRKPPLHGKVAGDHGYTVEYTPRGMPGSLKSRSGFFYKRENAERRADKLTAAGHSNVRVVYVST